MEGRIFDIQRFSIYDGPGIRTCVFFKGCNLRCLWCHNPESQSFANQLMFYSSKCVGCGKCAQVCSNTFTSDCTACGKCVAVCEKGARQIAGKTVSSDEVVSAVLKDRAFYETSGGGVTLSGGEALLQPGFALEILKKCKENGIDTAIETAGLVPWEVFRDVLPYLDRILFDIKCMDPEKHKALTGADNSLILQNAALLKESGKEIVFRMPVIPGLNDGEVEKAAAFARPCRFEILAYHTTGCGKYAALNKEYSIPDIQPPSAEFMRCLAEKTGAEYNSTGM